MTPLLSQAETSDSLWNYGLALSYLKIEHYPGSKDFSWLFAPLPVVEYRGKVARADQNDGARAFLLKNEDWELDFSGGLQPGQSYAQDEARDGMPSIPWVIEMGPQIVRSFGEHWQFRLGLFPSFSTVFSSAKANGVLYDARVVFKNLTRLDLGFPVVRGDYLAWSLQGASQEFMSTYYDVPAAYARADRNAYDSKGGILYDELSIYETFNSGLNTIYVGAYLDDYDIASNRGSPLLKAHQNLSFFIAYGYTFGQSQKPSVDIDETEGLINRLKERRENR